MKQFFKDLFSGTSATSSKRFAALFTLANVIILAYVAAYNSPNKILPAFMWTGLIIIVGAGLGLTVIEKIFGKGNGDNTPPSDDQQ
jgi:hypothetical protein